MTQPTPQDRGERAGRGRPSRSGGTRGGFARHGRLPVARSWAVLLRTLALAVAVILVSGTSVAAIAAATLSNSVSSVHLGPAGVPNRTGAQAFQGAVDFVMVGSDTRHGQTEAAAGDPGTVNNDVTILVHVSADHQQLTAVSFPRDLVTQLPGCTDTDNGQVNAARRGQFNESLARGGQQGGLTCVVNSVALLTGIQAPFAGILKFDGVAAMSTAVGGVQVCVASPIHDPYVGLDLGAGEQTVNGAEASAFVRSRHGVDDGSDVARISNQQVFLSALMRKVTAPGGALSNPLTLYELAHAALSNMVLSDNLDNVTTAVSLASTLRTIPTSHMLFVQYPTMPDPADINRLVAIPDAAHTLDVALRTDAKTNLDDSVAGRGAVVGSGSTGTPTAAPSSAAPTTRAPTQSGTPSARSTPLPSSITGQTADEATCSKGSG